MDEQRSSPDYEMEEFFEAGEPGHFRAFADPTRQRIVSLLYERAATGKQLAGALGLSPGTVGHHLKVLEEAGLVRVVRTRKVRAMTEKYYGNSYRQISFSDRNFTWKEQMPQTEQAFLLRQALEEFEVNIKPKDIRLNMLTYDHARVPESVAGNFAERVLELAKEFDCDPVPGERVYAFLGGVFLTDLPELPENDGEHGAS